MKPPAPSRDGCFYCGTPGFKGCDHYAPCEPAVILRLPDGMGVTTHRVVAPKAGRRGYETRPAPGKYA